MTLEEYIAEVQARMDETTPGPWEYTRYSPASGATKAAVRTVWNRVVGNWQSNPNARDCVAPTLLRWGTPEYLYANDEPNGLIIAPPYHDGAMQEFADLRFIAAAHSDVPKLLRIVEKLLTWGDVLKGHQISELEAIVNEP